MNAKEVNIIGIIPARMGSSRFPGKPLTLIAGLPMIEHVYKRSAMAKCLKSVYVATCDQEIEQVAKVFGGQVVMTKSTHERASDRVAEAMLKIEEDQKEKVDIVVMIQGDEPMVYPEMIEASVEPLLNATDVYVSNLMAKIHSQGEFQDTNEIKVVVDQDNFAVYFSRQSIPFSRIQTSSPIQSYKQVCIIPFKRDYLLKFNRMIQTPLEICESVDMLRFLETGHRVKMVYTSYETYSVDTSEDARKVEGLMKKDPLLPAYKT